MFSHRHAPSMLVLLLCAAAAAGCEQAGASAPYLDLSSDRDDLEAVLVTVAGANGVLVLDQRFPESGGALSLPGRVQLEPSGREGPVRVWAWGLVAGQRVAFGSDSGSLGGEEPLTLSVRLGAPPADGDGDWVPDALDGCPGVADPRQEDADADGTTDACELPADPCPGNILTQATFEQGTSGWFGVDGTVARVAGGRNGSAYAALVCNPGSTRSTYAIEADPFTVADPPVGARYRLEGWVRAPGAAGQSVAPLLREMDSGGGQLGDSGGNGVTVDEDWQQLVVSYQVAHEESVQVELEFASFNASGGACFQLDDVCLQRVQ